MQQTWWVQNQLLCSQALRASLPVLVLVHASKASSIILPRQGAGPALPSASASEGKGQLSGSHDPGTSSPNCHRWQEAREQSASPLCPHHVTAGEWWDQLSYAHSFKVAHRSPPPPRSESLCCPVEVQGLFFQILKLLRGEASSLECSNQ